METSKIENLKKEFLNIKKELNLPESDECINSICEEIETLSFIVKNKNRGNLTPSEFEKILDKTVYINIHGKVCNPFNIEIVNDSIFFYISDVDNWLNLYNENPLPQEEFEHLKNFMITKFPQISDIQIEDYESGDIWFHIDI